VTTSAFDGPLKYRLTKNNPASQLMSRLCLLIGIACTAGTLALVGTGAIDDSDGMWLTTFFIGAWLVVTLGERFMGAKEVQLHNDRIEVQKLVTRDRYRLKDVTAEITSLGSQGLDTRLLARLLRLDTSARCVELRISRAGVSNVFALTPSKVQLYVDSPEALLVDIESKTIRLQ
jgi:hypothetical protein